MKRFPVVTAAVAILVIAGMTSTASAQRQGGRGFGRGGAVGLVTMEAVQKELNLTSEQKEKLQTALRRERGGNQNLSREERQKRFQELAKKADETIKNTLDEKQQKRLEELRIQREGATALTRPEVAKKLGLDEAQQEKIKKIVADNAQTRSRTSFQNATQEERQKFFAEARERREKENTALLAVLTADQKKAFEKMEGEKFTFPRRGRNRNQNQ